LPNSSWVNVTPPILPNDSTIQSMWVTINSITAPPGVPTQDVYTNWEAVGDIINITAKFDYNATTVTYNATWVHNLVGIGGKYVPYNGSDSAFTTPLLPAPPTPEITQAYLVYYHNPPVTYTVNEYPKGSFSYAPWYLNFPATSYTGFPSYFGKYVLPAYGVTVGYPTKLYYATEWFNSGPYTYGYIADTVVANLTKPVTTFELWIDPNIYLQDYGLIQGVIQQPGFSAIQLYLGIPLGSWQLVSYMPVYVVAPAGTDILSAY